MKKVVLTLSCRIRDLRNIQLKQEMALEKFKKLAGEDWRKSKYIWAISSVKAMVHQIQTAITKCLKTIQKIMEIGS